MIDENKLIEELKEKICNIPAIEKAYEMFYHNSGYNCAITTAELLIKNQPKVGEWIPCSERLPEDETLMYWTTHEDGSLVMHGYTKRNGFIYNWEVDDLEKRERQGQVIAWTPIFKPEPYKEEVTE